MSTFALWVGVAITIWALSQVKVAQTTRRNALAGSVRPSTRLAPRVADPKAGHTIPGMVRYGMIPKPSTAEAEGHRFGRIGPLQGTPRSGG